jgi:D-3-phosphoglycerate dehydrogenase / 2-oxoglutarate reductase
VPVCYCPGVNHTTVAEHAFALLLAVSRQVVTECQLVKSGQWKRLTGHELLGKRIAILGMGRIGREVALRARAFGMEVTGFDKFWNDEFARQHQVRRAATVEEALPDADVVTLHVNLSPETRHLIDARRLGLMKPGAILINTARGELVDSAAVVEALRASRLLGYGADVLEEEPPPKDHPLFACPTAVLTPHIGSRTYESVVRQATMAAENLLCVLRGKKPLAQAN